MSVLRAAVALALAALSATASATPTRQDAEACARLIEHDDTIAQHDSRCSEVTTAFHQQLGADHLELTPAILRDWAMTLPSASGAGRRPAPDPGQVNTILTRMEQEEAARPLSLWERLRRWLDSLADRNDDKNAPGWLIRLFDALAKIPNGAVNIIFWCLVALLAVTLGVLIVAELRANGILGGQRTRAGSAAAGDRRTAERTEPLLTLDRISGLPAESRAPALLRWLLQALAQRQLLRPDRALTNGELAKRLPAGKAGGFRRFLGFIEPALYGGVLLDDETFVEACALASSLAGPAEPGPTGRPPAAVKAHE